MLNQLKSFAAIGTAVLASFTFQPITLANPGYVSDHAEVLSIDSERMIAEEIKEFQQSTSLTLRVGDLMCRLLNSVYCLTEMIYYFLLIFVLFFFYFLYIPNHEFMMIIIKIEKAVIA